MTMTFFLAKRGRKDEASGKSLSGSADAYRAYDERLPIMREQDRLCGWQVQAST